MDVELLAGLGVAVFILAMSMLVADEVGDPVNVSEAQIVMTPNH